MTASVRPGPQHYRKLLDDVTPHAVPRWIGLGVLALLYAVRVVYFISGFYIVTYALGIYLLNLLIAFLSPRIDPAMEAELVRALGVAAMRACRLLVDDDGGVGRGASCAVR